MLPRLLLCLTLILTSAGCDGLDDIVLKLSGAESDENGGDDGRTTVPFVNQVKVGGELDDWNTSRFATFSDHGDDSTGSNNYGELLSVELAHNVNNLYIAVERADEWDPSSDAMSVDIEVDGVVLAIVVDLNGSLNSFDNGSNTCNNSNQEQLEFVQDGAVTLLKIPLTSSDISFNCIQRDIERFDNMTVSILNSSGECDGACDELGLQGGEGFTLGEPASALVLPDTNSSAFQTSVGAAATDNESATLVDWGDGFLSQPTQGISKANLAWDPTNDLIFFGVIISDIVTPGADDQYTIKLFAEGSEYLIKLGDLATVPALAIEQDGDATCDTGPLSIHIDSALYAFMLEIPFDCFPGISSDDTIQSIVFESIDTSSSDDIVRDVLDVRRVQF